MITFCGPNGVGYRSKRNNPTLTNLSAVQNQTNRAEGWRRN